MCSSDLEAEQATYRILREDCQIAEPHCVHQYDGRDFGIGHLAVADEGSYPVLVGQRPGARSLPSFAHKRGASADEGRGGFEAIQNIRTNRVREYLSPDKQECSAVLTRKSSAAAVEARKHLPEISEVSGILPGAFRVH